ncbi:hypothetical protein DCAR_0104115 [Daucus carota subsp. sativus]|uniref:Uncharacterized protein n=1 Tax=Daucus carota subsp. sativus TaxID=79200 RepID=A0AAF1ALX4_DAUCS|nr:hypothetical protein DCAR_0104115 [Daucus carota subsp. sativus]
MHIFPSSAMEKVTFFLAVEWVPMYCGRVPCIPNLITNQFTLHGLRRSRQVGEKDDADVEKVTTDIDEAMAQAVDIGENDEKPRKNGMSLDEAIDDPENITDFILDLDEDVRVMSIRC